MIRQFTIDTYLVDFPGRSKRPITIAFLNNGNAIIAIPMTLDTPLYTLADWDILMQEYQQLCDSVQQGLDQIDDLITKLASVRTCLYRTVSWREKPSSSQPAESETSMDSQLLRWGLTSMTASGRSK